MNVSVQLLLLWVAGSQQLSLWMLTINYYSYINLHTTAAEWPLRCSDCTNLSQLSQPHHHTMTDKSVKFSM